MTQFLHVPFIGKLIHRLDADISAYGLQKATVNLANNLQISITINGINKQLEEILINKPILIVCNHQHELDLLILTASLPDRKDIFLIASSDYSNISANIDRHIIPTFIQNRLKQEKGLELLTKILRRFHKVPQFSPDLEHKKNLDSIDYASKMIARGHLVTIFPGKKNPDENWYDGVGYLIDGVDNNDTFIVKCSIQGTSPLDFLRIIPGIKNMMHSVKVTYSEPQIIKDFIGNKPKDITKALEKSYRAWVKILAS